MTTLFNSDGSTIQPQGQTELEGSALEVLVGDGKKFKDVEALARAKMESDAFIEQLKREAAGVREELNTRVNMQDFLDQLKAQTSRSEPDPQVLGDQVDTGKPLSDEELQSKVDAILNKKQLESEAQRNEAFVVSELVKVYGNNYEAKVLARASELGVNKEFLLDMAKRTPKAFLELVVVQTTRNDPNQAVPPRSSGAPPSPLSQGVRNESYYKKLKKDNPVLYLSPKVQLQEYQDAMKLGEAFFN